MIEFMITYTDPVAWIVFRLLCYTILALLCLGVVMLIWNMVVNVWDNWQHEKMVIEKCAEIRKLFPAKGKNEWN